MGVLSIALLFGVAVAMRSDLQSAQLSAAHMQLQKTSDDVSQVEDGNSTVTGCPRGAFTVTSPHENGWSSWPVGVPIGAKVTYLGSLPRYRDKQTEKHLGQTGVVVSDAGDGLKLAPGMPELVTQGSSACYFTGKVKFPNSLWQDGDTFHAAAFQVTLMPENIDIKSRSEGPMLPLTFQHFVRDNVIGPDLKVKPELLTEVVPLVPDMVVRRAIKVIVEKELAPVPEVNDMVVSVFNKIPPLELFDIIPVQAVVADMIVREIAKPDPPSPRAPSRRSTDQAVASFCHQKPTKIKVIKCCWQFCHLLPTVRINACLKKCQA